MMNQFTRICLISVLLISTVIAFGGCCRPIKITSEPEGADVVIDDDVIGKTPLTTKLHVLPVQPQYPITVRKPGYFEKTVLARAQESDDTYFPPVHVKLEKDPNYIPPPPPVVEEEPTWYENTLSTLKFW